MNDVLRVLLVTRRFWPLSGDVAWRWLAIATAMRQAGWRVEVVSALWHSQWPAHVRLREFPVQRIYPSPTTPFRMRRAMRCLVEWVQTEHSRSTIDMVLVDAAEDEASALLDHARDLPPIVVRYESITALGTLSQKQRQRALSNCQRAHRVIVASDYGRRELIGGGLRAERIQLIADAPLQKISRDPASTSAARRALADINHELFLRSDDRLCVCLSDLTGDSGVEFVTRTIGPILERERGVRLWLVGDGPERMRLYEILRREGWRQDILIPGSFEDPDLVLAAANLCIVPSAKHGSTWILPTALGSGLTTFVGSGSEISSKLGGLGDDLVFGIGEQDRLAALFTRWLHRSRELDTTVGQVCQYLWSRDAKVEQYRGLVE